MYSLENEELFLSTCYEDEHLFTKIYTQYRSALYAIALPICGYAYADDAVQDALITAYTKFHQLRNPKALVPWLERITLNSSYQIIRKIKPTIGLDEIPLPLEPVETNIEEYMDHLAERDHLYASLAAISPVLQQPLLLRYFSDYNSYEQISKVLNIPIGTVRSRLNAGRTELVKQWKLDREGDTSALDSARYWNQYYRDLIPAVHYDKAAFSELERHANANFELVLTSGRCLYGRQNFMDTFYDDLEHGSTIAGVTACLSSGDITVMNLQFANSAEYPDHCPPGSLIVIQRDITGMKRMKLYHAPREGAPVGSKYA